MMRKTESPWLYRHAGGVGLVGLALFAAIALLVAIGATTAVDAYANSLAKGWGLAFPPLVHVANAATLLGTGLLLGAVALVAALLVAWQGRRSEMILPFLPLAVEWVTDPLIKGLFLRHRPFTGYWAPGLFGNDQYSFPSGHAMSTAALYTLLAFWAWAWWPGRGRLIVTILMVLVPLVVGLTRVVLGVHWLSDVLGGWTAGFTVACFVVLVWVRIRGARNR